MTLDENVNEIRKRLRIFYAVLVAPAAVIFALAYALRKLGVEPFENAGAGRIAGPAIFIAAAVLALALPIFHRGLFAHRLRGEKSVLPARYTVYQKTQIALAATASYFALAGFLLNVSRFHLLGAVLFALYGLYYYYPSELRIRREMRMFRVGDEFTKEDA